MFLVSKFEMWRAFDMVWGRKNKCWTCSSSAAELGSRWTFGILKHVFIKLVRPKSWQERRVLGIMLSWRNNAEMWITKPQDIKHFWVSSIPDHQSYSLPIYKGSDSIYVYICIAVMIMKTMVLLITLEAMMVCIISVAYIYMNNEGPKVALPEAFRIC